MSGNPALVCRCGQDWTEPGGVVTDERERARYRARVADWAGGGRIAYGDEESSETQEVFYLCGSCERSIDADLLAAGVRGLGDGGGRDA